MKISLQWLREYVEWSGSPQELADRLTQSGLNVEDVSEYIRSFPDVVVADVISREKHPDADKLSVCKVFDGSETNQVICGAPNIKAGQLIPYAQIGSKLPNGLKIKKGF